MNAAYRATVDGVLHAALEHDVGTFEGPFEPVLPALNDGIVAGPVAPHRTAFGADPGVVDPRGRAPSEGVVPGSRSPAG